MNFTVVWDDDAEATLAAIWLAAPDRAAVTRAVDVLERKLQTDPANTGESRPNGRRVAFEAPIGIRFKAVGGGVVRVINVWAYRHR